MVAEESMKAEEQGTPATAGQLPTAAPPAPSWSSIMRSAVPNPVSVKEEQAPSKSLTRVAVVDANAIISGVRLDSIADRFYTVADVLAEVRDKQARAFLATLPYKIEMQEPGEESVKAVLRFARATGDLQTLSAVDMKLLALAHSLELAAHGTIHLREQPARPRLQSKHRSKGKGLPGWGNVPNPQDWAALDNLDDDGSAIVQGVSRINAQVQQLNLDQLALDDTASIPTPPSTAPAHPVSQQANITAVDTCALDSSTAPSSLPANPLHKAAPSSMSVQGTSQQPSVQPVVAPVAAAGLNAMASGRSHADAGPPLSCSSDEDEDEQDEGGWNTVSKSKMAARRQKRKAQRIAVWEVRRLEQEAQQQRSTADLAMPALAATPLAAATASTAAAAGAKVDGSSADGVAKAAPGATAGGAGAAAARGMAHATASATGEDEQSDDGSGADDDSQEEDTESGTDDGLEQEQGEDDEGQDDDEEEGSTSGEEEGWGDDHTCTDSQMGDPGVSEAGGSSLAEPLPNTDSSVVSVTADFAMQNVLLQMGLRLVAADGRHITRLTRWALRCSACFGVTKEAGRLFCPRCGNMTLDRVELTVGADGSECYGVKKRHNLRGTRYSLPKPKGGRNQGEPILREDTMLLKVKKKSRRKAAAAATGADGLPAEPLGVDPFAPEFTSESWYKGQQIAGDKGFAAALAGWKHNPNERKNIARSNRRK